MVLFLQNVGPVANGNEFRQFGTDHQHSGAAGDKRLHQLVNLRLCANVDAPCRLIKDENSRSGVQPFSDHDFLLISSAEKPCGTPRGRSHDTQPLDDVFDSALRLRERVPAAGKELTQSGSEHVVVDRTKQSQSFRLAVFRNQPDAASRPLPQGLSLNSSSSYDNFSLDRRIRAENRASQFRAPGADEARKADDLPGTQCEVGPSNAALRVKALHVQDRLLPAWSQKRVR